MFVEHPHTYQGSGVGYMSIDALGLAVPKGPSSVTSAVGNDRNPVKPVSITASTSVACPNGPCTVRDMTAS